MEHLHTTGTKRTGIDFFLSAKFECCVLLTDYVKKRVLFEMDSLVNISQEFIQKKLLEDAPRADLSCVKARGHSMDGIVLDIFARVRSAGQA